MLAYIYHSFVFPIASKDINVSFLINVTNLIKKQKNSVSLETEEKNEYM